jgi:tetratricopeptide (TPR) repeat protein
MRRIVMALALSATGLLAQEDPMKKLSDLMDQAGNASNRGDKAEALKLLKTALSMTSSTPALKGKRLEVLRGMGHVYEDAKQYPQAVQAYTMLVNSAPGGCLPGKPEAERCAEVFYDMGRAQMFQSDFAGAVITLKKAFPLYAALIKSGTGPDYKMAKLKLQANARSMLGAALFRSGDLDAAIVEYQKAIGEYQTVANNPEATDGLKMLAKQSMAQEQQSLDLLKHEQIIRAAQKKEAEKKQAAPKETPKK